MTPLLFGSFFLALSLSAYEFVAVLRARLSKKTLNTRRVVVRGLIFSLILCLIGQYIAWQSYIADFSYAQLNDAKVNNTPYLLTVVAIGISLLLVSFELVRHYQAKKAGTTRNRSRLVTGVLILFCLLPILKATMDMWDVYVEKITNARPPPPAFLLNK